ncbi:fructosamine kinase family protein [Thiomicrorhabdus lithotrophica]|uniref:Fructosamine kinase family protein n=1 Tax=Thiomicrorhabdus lithotrophica TaxID=2949997 RepID=A0ABY8CB90_9GAMM|nr:fructosamine kinase family protein [Thiomicrorhabdus lithotrophica]WEJ62492.1 fructosamine kinase family protein [Thiomicrorhabdus lithotrophica]
MDWQTFSQHLSTQLNQSIEIETALAVSGGDIHQAYQLHTNQGNLFLKLNQSHLLPLFETETHNLNAIDQSNSIRCPKVIGSGVFQNNQAWLLMEHLNLTKQGDDFQRGRDLAFMHHQIHKSPQPFGWFEDNYIGHTIQRNQWHFDWIEFYGSQRLQPQLELAQLRGASPTLFDLGQQLIDALPFWFQDYQPEASLLHGDLWGGNSAFVKETYAGSNTTEAVIYDPACYYGDRETDIAMTELFGGFSAEFYTGYNDVFPLNKGFAQRKPLYNLYHVLNHFNLFGGQYEQQALQIMQALLKQSQK